MTIFVILFCFGISSFKSIDLFNELNLLVIYFSLDHKLDTNLKNKIYCLL